MHALATAATLISGVALVSAHGHVQVVTADGVSYRGADPAYAYITPYPSDIVGWRANNLDNGFVDPSAFGTVDINCHKSSVAAPAFVPVKSGSKIGFQWNTWPDSHVGPVIDYISPYSSSPGSLSWTKIDQAALKSGSNPGKWATDDLIANNFTWTTTLPNLKAGDYVIRHEIIALHAASASGGAQSYPQCINIRVSGSGSAAPSGGVAGTSLYKATDAGIAFNVHTTFSSYPIPGPSVATFRKMLARYNVEDNVARAAEAVKSFFL